VKRAIFISYRRDDAEGEAGRLFDDLVRVYGDDSVFMDVAGIAPGSDFRKAIDENVATCGVFLTIIGPNWATVAHPDGGRRLDDTNDFVRLEVGSALARNIAVIPVLVHDARMPHPDQLPENIRDLAFRNSVEISHARWNSDVQLLIAALKQYVTTTPATESQPVHATIPSQLPPPVAPAAEDSGKKPAQPLIWGGAIAVLVAVAVIGYMAWPKHDHHRGGLGIPVEMASAPPTTGVQQGGAAPPTAGAGAQQAVPATAPQGSLAGLWTNPHTAKSRDALTEIRISGSGPQYIVEPFGDCGKQMCNWGAQTLTFNGVSMVGKWSLGNTVTEQKQDRVVTVELSPNGSGLGVETQNTWVDTAGQTQHNGFKYVFVRGQ